MREIHLTRDQVPSSLRGSYPGNKFKAVVGDTVTIPAGAGLWEGGSRDAYQAVRLADGAAVTLPGQDAAPWDRSPHSVKVELPPGFAIVRHSTFCGQDSGLTFYVRGDDVAPLLPKANGAELSREAAIVLHCLSGIVSSYRRDAAARHGVNAKAYEAALAELIAAGLANSRGAITVDGKNRVAALPRVSL